MNEETKPGVNLPLIIALAVVAIVAAVASAIVVRRRSDQLIKKIQQEGNARLDELEKALMLSRAELRARADPGPQTYQLPPFSPN